MTRYPDEVSEVAEPATPDADKLIVLYDGVCGLCNGFVRFLLERDRRGLFQFAPLQSEFARSVVAERGGDPEELSTIYVIEGFATEGERVRLRGRAALHCVTALGRGWRLLGAFRILPSVVLDLGYRLVAKVRYRLFGRHETCPVPGESERSKFIATG